jgi:GrpB-like predicted nucleotidyltransferase (UPF0157 family)
MDEVLKDRLPAMGFGSEWERRHLLFRDCVRASAPARENYRSSKQGAAERWSDDRIAYTDAKDGTIRKLMAEAEAWAARPPSETSTTLPPTAC